jgi:hypothetical protein
MQELPHPFRDVAKNDKLLKPGRSQTQLAILGQAPPLSTAKVNPQYLNQAYPVDSSEPNMLRTSHVTNHHGLWELESSG